MLGTCQPPQSPMIHADFEHGAPLAPHLFVPAPTGGRGCTIKAEGACQLVLPGVRTCAPFEGGTPRLWIGGWLPIRWVGLGGGGLPSAAKTTALTPYAPRRAACLAAAPRCSGTYT